MTAPENKFRERQTIERIQASFLADPQLAGHIDELTIELGRDGLVISGTVGDQKSLSHIVPCIRRAGVLAQVQNRVVSATLVSA